MGSLPRQEYQALVGSMRETALLDSKMISVTKGMRILQKKLLELWDRYRLDTPLVNMIIRFLDLPTRVFRQLELNQRYAPNLPGGLMNQIRDFPTQSYYYREGWRAVNRYRLTQNPNTPPAGPV
jgi:hypothetical protein